MEKRKWANSNTDLTQMPDWAADSEAAKALQADLWLPADVAVAGKSGHPPQPQNCAADHEEI